jgi:acetyl-CoA carboxylase carboxyl transferase subunit alpha
MSSINKQSLDFEKPLLILEKQLDELMQSSANSDMDFTDEIRAIEKKIELTKRQVYSDLSSWQKVQLSRQPNRPYSPDLIPRIFTNIEELQGDR